MHAVNVSYATAGRSSPIDNVTRTHYGPSNSQNVEVDCFSHIREALESTDLPKRSIDLILSSWRGSTKKQYRSYLTRWVLFCEQKQVDSVYTTATIIIKFLAGLFTKGLGYSSLNTAKSAICSFINIITDNNFGENMFLLARQHKETI